MMRRGLLALALVLAGCGGSEPEPTNRSVVIIGNADELIVPVRGATNPTNAAAAAEPVVRLAPDGLVLGSGAGRIARFGMPRAAVTQMLAAALGDPVDQIDNQECSAGALGFASFRDGLGVYFQAGKFVGWDLDGNDPGHFSTAAGIGIGSSRKQLEAAAPATVQDTTLGIEFSAGGMSGLLNARDAAGEITNLWAGVTCIAR